MKAHMNTGPTDTCTALALIASMFSMYCDSVEIIANSCCAENIVTHISSLELSTLLI